MHLLLRFESMGFILRFSPSSTYFFIQRIEFLVPYINLIFRSLSNLLNSIFLSFTIRLNICFICGAQKN